jgi:hypothetical protein
MFHRIKKKLIKNNKVKNYIKYACGEIILVMLGILLALQVNTWNENRKNSEKEQVILGELNKDFTLNLSKFQEVKKLQYSTYKCGSIVFRNINKLDILESRDSVYKYVTGMFGGYTYYPSNGVVESLISTGDIRYIKNDTLKKYLVSWADVLTDYSERVAIDIDFWSNQIEPYLIKNGDFYNLSSDKNKALVLDTIFINMLVRKQHYNSNVVSAIENKEGIEFYMKEITRLSKVNEENNRE